MALDRTASGPLSQDRQAWRRCLDQGFSLVIILWLLFASNAILPTLMTDGGAVDFDARGLAIMAHLSTLCLAISLVFVLLYGRELTLLFARNKTLILLMGLSALSYIWSHEPSVTLRRSLLLISFTIIAAVLVLKRDLGDIVKILFDFSVLVVLTSLILLIALPELGFNIDGRGARGAFVHKNIFSVFLVVALAAAAAALRMRRVSRWMGYGFIALCLLLLLLSNSATAWAAGLVMLGLHILIRMKRLPFQIHAIAIAFGVALILFLTPLAMAYYDVLFAGLDRDPTLTGRDEVWAYTLRMIEERPWLGYGYAAFWESEPYQTYVMQTLNWKITHAHNGYLGVWLELGIIGLSLTVLYFITCLIRLFMIRPAPDIFIFVLPTMVGLLAYNLAETKIMIAKDLGWLILLICAFLTTPGLNDIRARYPRIV